MGASGGSEEQNPEGDGNSGGPANVLIAALAGTTALFGAVTVTLVVAVILLYIRHSRRMKRNCSDVKEEKKCYWLPQEENLDEKLSSSTPNVWLPFQPTTNTFRADQNGNGTTDNIVRCEVLVTSLSVDQLNLGDLEQETPKSIAIAVNPPVSKKSNPKRIAPPPPRKKKKNVSRKHLSIDNDYDWPDIARDYQNVHHIRGIAIQTKEEKSEYKKLDLKNMDTPNPYAIPQSL